MIRRIALGAVVEVQDPSTADFVIDYQAFTPIAINARTTHSTGEPFLAGGEITFNAVAMAEGEDLFRDGQISRDAFLRGISGIAAPRDGAPARDHRSFHARGRDHGTGVPRCAEHSGHEYVDARLLPAVAGPLIPSRDARPAGHRWQRGQ